MAALRRAVATERRLACLELGDLPIRSVAAPVKHGPCTHPRLRASSVQDALPPRLIRLIGPADLRCRLLHAYEVGAANRACGCLLSLGARWLWHTHAAAPILLGVIKGYLSRFCQDHLFVFWLGDHGHRTGAQPQVCAALAAAGCGCPALVPHRAGLEAPTPHRIGRSSTFLIVTLHTENPHTSPRSFDSRDS